MKDYRKIWVKAVPYIVPVIIFYCVSAFCFAPQFAGKVLPQHDTDQYEGMWRDIREMREATGEDAQWTGAMFSGMPAYLINVKYPSQLVKNTVGTIVKAVKTPAGFIFFVMTAMWIMMLLLGCPAWVGTVSALAYGLSTYFFLIIGAGHVTKMWALVYAPLMMGGAFTVLRGRMWAGAVITALFASLEIGANHPQITYYFLIAMGAFWVSELICAIRGKRAADFAKRTAVLVAAGIAAAGSNFAPLWYTSRHSGDTIRGGSELTADTGENRGLDLQYATAWSYGIGESWNMLIPDFAGGDSASSFSADGAVADVLTPYGLRQVAKQLPSYWGGQPYTAGPTYLGAAAIFLALLGILLAGGRDRWWLIAVMLLMLLLAWGRNFMGFTEFCFKYLPFYDKFRTVSTTLVVLEWGIPLLAGIAVWKLWQSGEHTDKHADGKTDKHADGQARRTLLRPIAWAAGITGGISLLFAVAGSTLFDFGQAEAEAEMTAQFYQMLRNSGADEAIAQGLHEQIGADLGAAMAEERAAIMSADAWRSFIFIALAALAAALFAMRKIGRGVLTAALAVIVTVDLAAVDLRYLPRDRFVPERLHKTAPTAADKEIMRDKDAGYRVYNLSVSPFNDATTSNFHRSVGGYHGAKLARYQDIIDIYLHDGAIDDGILDMLNTRYIITRDGRVVRRDSANGAAWFVDEVIPLPTAREEIEALRRIDTKHTAVTSPARNGNPSAASPAKNGTSPALDNLGSGGIRLVEYRPNYLRYEYTADADAFAVFSEIFYDKGWTAHIDGSADEAPYCRADYILRGMELPAGTHTVEWKFRAPSWGVASAITALFSLAILAATAAAIIMSIVRKRKNGEQQPQA